MTYRNVVGHLLGGRVSNPPNFSVDSFPGGEKGHGGLDGEVAGAAGGGFGDEDKTTGGDDVDPAPGAGDGGNFAEFLLIQEVFGGVSGPEVE